MTKAEYQRWLDERIAWAVAGRREATERGEQLLYAGYRDAYIHARDQARRITSLVTGDDGNGDAQYDYEAAAERERQAEAAAGWTERELAYVHGDR